MVLIKTKLQYTDQIVNLYQFYYFTVIGENEDPKSAVYYNLQYVFLFGTEAACLIQPGPLPYAPQEQMLVFVSDMQDDQ